MLAFAICMGGGSFFFASCNSSKEKNFTALTAHQTHIDFENIPASREGLNILYYIYYYNGGGVATGDINNDGLTDIYFTANDKGKNKLYLNKGNFEFEDITEKAGVAGLADWCTGVTMADVNADGWLDIYVCAVSKKHGLAGHNMLFINNGASLGETGRKEVTFTESAAQYGLDFSGYSTQAAFFDADHDGDLDCYVLNQSDRPYQYIVDTSHRRKSDANAGDRFFRNDLNGASKKFTDITVLAGIYQSSLDYGLGLAVADLNNDGWEDIYVGNDFHENDYYYVNNQNGTFTESGAKAFNHYSRFSMGNDVADYNNDGNLDVLTVDMLPPDEKILKTYGSDERADIYNFKITKNGYQSQVSRNCLQRNNGDGKSFSDVGLSAGIAATDWSWSALMTDFDNDGYKDIFISSGIVKRPVDLDYIRFVSDLARKKQSDPSANLDMQALEKMPEGSSYCFLYKGNGEGKFIDKSDEWGIAHKKGFYTAAAYADFDNDGDLDIVVNPLQSKAFIYRNNSAPKNYLQIKFRGDSLNRLGIGTKAYVFHNGKMQYQQVTSVRGFQSSSCTPLHFGVDAAASVDSLLIVWPDAAYQVLKGIATNKVLTIEKREAGGRFEAEGFFYQKPGNLSLLPSLLEKPWRHKEDRFDDFTVQYLIPHMLSTRGPKLAVADVNKDGLDDFFVGGAIGQAGRLFIQNLKGTFTPSDTALFLTDAAFEDVDACFFDANSDTWPDLFVVSGGNYYKTNSPYLADRLYLNNGKGHFTKAEKSLPQLWANKSCVSAGDLDGDGDIDLFVGGLADPLAYGLPQSSYLLLNNGKGEFQVAGDELISLKNIGMVTASAITDVNKDGRNDLVLAGEWMPVTVFINSHKNFKAQQLDAGGLWQSLKIEDINDDGFPDILAGNWGLNSKLVAGKSGPLKLYVSDFDNNGKADPVLAYTINGIEYPFWPKDEIEQVMPIIRKKFLYYADYSGKPIQEIFDLDTEKVLTLKVNDLSSAIFMNDGKGNFTRRNFPGELQLSPLFAFQQSQSAGFYLAGGNFYNVLPYEGQYDAASLLSFRISKTRDSNHFIPQPTVLDTKGQVRDLQWLHTARNGDVLIVARNNDSLLFYGINKPKK